VWNSQKYIVALNMMQLKLVLADKDELLKPGGRDELLQTLVLQVHSDRPTPAH
jgi:hypothetical protein